MGYQHMFYGLDLNRLRSIYGSKDSALVEEVLRAQADELENNDAFFEDRIAEGTFPNSETALREIVDGAPRGKNAEAMYGYVLKILCEHFGELLGADVYAVRDHPYDSKLARSGPPIPIPCDDSDFPEMGFLSVEDIPAEIAMIDAAPKRARRWLRLFMLSFISRGLLRLQMSDEEAVEDMTRYREVLEDALSKHLSIVSFRH